jgi:hypothetical protein
MNRVWKFTDTEFFALWSVRAPDQMLPWPFFYTTRQHDSDIFDAERLAALERLRKRLEPSFDDVMTALVQNDMKIAVFGWDSRAPREPDGLLRLLAIRRGDYGYLVTQLAGEEFSYASGFTVAETDAIKLADAVLDAMPETGAGRLPDIVLPTPKSDEEQSDEAALDYSYGRSAVQDSFSDTVAERAERFLNTPAPSMGSIEIIQGRSIFGPRGITQHRLEWRDLEDDGRYVVDDQHPPVATAVGRERLISLINTRIVEVVRAIKDERIRG